MRKRRFVIKSKKQTGARLAVLLGAALLICGAILGVFVLLSAHKNTADFSPLPFNVDANYSYTGSGFLYLSGGKLYYDDIADAKKNTSFIVSSEDVRLASSSALMVLYNDNAVQIVGAQASLLFTGTVLSVACDAQHVAVLNKDGDGNSSLFIYNAQGDQIDKLDFAPGALINFGFAKAGEETLWTLELNVTGSLPISTLTTYNLTTNHTTGVVSVHSQLVDKVVFTETSIFLSGTANLIRYNRMGNSEAYRQLVYGWELADYSTTSSTPLMLYTRRGGQIAGGVVRLLSLPEGDVASAAAQNVQLPADTISAFISGGKLVACTPTDLYTYTSAGKLSGKVPLPMQVRAVKKLAGGYALFTAGNGLYVSPIK
ncbi:MAG: hypothetical protein LBN26_05345 [Christensenellaceae bacterium]|jgi:hypothetical protein|nr:hypothetical protein [Christensenellaceae bacterium]